MGRFWGYIWQYSVLSYSLHWYLKWGHPQKCEMKHFNWNYVFLIEKLVHPPWLQPPFLRPTRKTPKLTGTRWFRLFPRKDGLRIEFVNQSPTQPQTSEKHKCKPKHNHSDYVLFLWCVHPHQWRNLHLEIQGYFFVLTKTLKITSYLSNKH